MKIELEKIENGLKIIDAVIRDYPADFSEGSNKESHFQARIQTAEISEEDSFTCNFAYYSKEGSFLGLDSDSEWVGDITLKDPYSISFNIYPPENTELVKCQIGVRRCKKGVWDYAWPVFVSLVLVWLASSIIKIWL